MSGARETATGDRRAAAARRECRRPFLAQSLGVRIYVLLVIVAHLGLLGYTAAGLSVHVVDLYTFGGLVLCGAICVEATRWLGLPPGVSRDMLSAWWLPVAILLPPAYALFAPALLGIVLHTRARQMPLFQRVFNIAALGLAGGVAALLFNWLMPGVHAGAPGWLIDNLGAGPGYAVLCGIVFAIVNTTLVGVAVYAASPGARWRDILGDREGTLLDVVEVCIGILVTIACALSPLLLLIALPPIILLQRSLLYQQLRTAARTDDKTGLLNAGTWQREAETRVRRSVQFDQPLAVLIADIDHFKRVNDRYGHLVGDQVLIGVAKTLRNQVRADDLVGRFGGEEFVALLPRTDRLEAHRVAERLRVRVSRMVVPGGDAAIRVTISIGVALLGEHGNGLNELLRAADGGLYRAKHAGRDRIRLPADPLGRAPLSPARPITDSPTADRW